jgi:putative transcriptional regulator
MKLLADNILPPQQGRLLVAEPFLTDRNFGRAVILLVEHNRKGSIGFILNKPLEMRVDEILPDFPPFEQTVYLGGPVQRNQLFYIHTLGEKLEGSMKISDDIWWLGDFEQLKTEILEGAVTPNQVRFFAGYSGWESGQLNRELEEKSWFVAQSRLDLVFHDAKSRHWNRTLQTMGSKFAMMANYPENPSLN